MSRQPIGERAMTPAERQRRRRARLAAERPPQHDPRDEEVSRLQAENARLRAARPAAVAPGDDEGLRPLVKRLRKEVAGLKAVQQAACSDDALRKVELRAQTLMKGIRPEDLKPGGDNPNWLAADLRSAIGAELERRRVAAGRIERKIAKIAAIAPDKATELRRKLEALAADPGATEGERTSALAAVSRLKAR